MLANLIASKDDCKSKKQSAYRIENPTPPAMREGKMFIWENIPFNDWRVAHRIMTGHMDHISSLPISLACALSPEEWEFLDKAASALALLGRMSGILPGLTSFVRKPGLIMESVAYSFQDTVRYGDSQNKSLDTPQARYALAWWIAVYGAVFRIRTKYGSDCPVARAICAVLFSKPYRSDWATCDLAEMERHAGFIHGLFEKHARDFTDYVWNRDIFYRVPSVNGDVNPIFYLASNLGALKQLVRPGENIPLRAARNRIGWDWLPEYIEIFDARCELGVLPAKAAAIPINTASNAYAPMYVAYDDCDMPMVLIPENPRIWDAMLGLYGLPKRDQLYPESPRVMDQLSPRSTHFAVEMSGAHGMVYTGVKSLGEYLPELTDADNPDYRFHVFAADLSKW